MHLQRHTEHATIAVFVAIVGADVMVSFYATPFPVLTLNSLILFNPGAQSTDWSDHWDNGRDYHRKEGRRFVFIWAELRRVDRI